ncbi:MAG: hypothetical protein JWS11_1567 [Cypionkella sp.]|nr:hypothetical protein [Cypionkella sp.]
MPLIARIRCRISSVRSWILALLLAGCTLGAGKLASPADSANPITGDAIAVTSLDAPAAKLAGGGVKPAVVVGDLAKADAVKADVITASPSKAEPAIAVEAPMTEAPLAVLSPEELACAKKGGQWTVAGKAGGMSCVSMMRDAGKSCRRQSDCEGSCLARSNTCAPIAPLFGCNEILQDNGAMVTLCID